MTGFFTDEELEVGTRQDFDLSVSGPNCDQCGLNHKCKSPRMNYTGQGKKKCLIIAEAQGTVEDEAGTQLVGPVGQFFRNRLKEHGLDLDRDFWKINAITCAPLTGKGIRTPTDSEVAFCRPIVQKAIEELKPDYIWLMGGRATYSFLKEDFKDTSISRWRGLIFPDQKSEAWVAPIFHPSYASRNVKDKNITSVYDRDLKAAAQLLNRKRYTNPHKDYDVECLTDFEEIVSTLKDLVSDPPQILVFDYETTGKKPYRPGHKIVSISFCEDPEVAYSFPYQYRDHFTSQQQEAIRSLWACVLRDKRSKKIAHKLNFEEVWSRVFFDTPVENWYRDTLLRAHILDPRKKYSGLKMQTYVHQGIRPWNKHIESFLRGRGSEFNRVENLDLNDLLMYGGKDSLYDFWVYESQEEAYAQRRPALSTGYDLFHEGTIELAEMEYTGICTDEEYYDEKSILLEEEVTDLKHQLEMENEEAQLFYDQTKRHLSITSNVDLGILLYDILKIPEVLTEKGNRKTDRDTVESFDLPFINDLIRMRRLEKVRGTYLAQFRRESYNGRMHPFFDLSRARSLRSASSEPNFQNVPIRWLEAKELCRAGIIPSLGHKLLEIDYKSIEVSIGACYHKDPNMIKYITDSSTDMHRDSAMDIWGLPQEEITPEIRFYAKNEWVFPQFYGSWFKECASNLWEHVDLETESEIVLRNHLAEGGIVDLEQFENHLNQVQNVFWNERFRVYDDWKKKVNAAFIKQGYVGTFFGFECKGVLSPRQAANRQIQGTAFHCLLWSLIRISRVMKKEKWNTKMIGQIHDSILFDLDPSEEEHVINVVNQISTIDIRKENPWIVVPLKVDGEITEIDGSWVTKKDIEFNPVEQISDEVRATSNLRYRKY